MRVTAIGCWGGSPRPDGACSGYLVEDNGARVLLDCGPGVCSHIQRIVPLAQVNHVVVSHYHYDHVSDAGAFMYARLVQRIVGQTHDTLNFYAPRNDERLCELSMDGSSRAYPIDQDHELQIGPFCLAFYRTSHPVECFAMRLQAPDGTTLGYTADAALTDGLAEFMSGVDLLVSECSLYTGVDGSAMGHMSCDDVAKLAKAAQPRTLLLTHLPIYGDPYELLLCARHDLETICPVDIACYGYTTDGQQSCNNRPQVQSDAKADEPRRAFTFIEHGLVSMDIRSA